MRTIAASVVVATFNAGEQLDRLVLSIRKQKLETTAELEIIVVDAASGDDTRNRARRLGCKVIENPRQDPVAGKHLGFLSAQSDNIMFLDQDEELLSDHSIGRKIACLAQNQELIFVLSSGYSCLPCNTGSQCYISWYGDPFSAFFFGQSSSFKGRRRSIERSLSRIPESFDGVSLWSGPLRSSRIIVEPLAGGAMVQRKRFLSRLPAIRRNASKFVSGPSQILREAGHLALLEDDPVAHFSSPKWSLLIPKIDWRIYNFLNEDASSLSDAGIRGRSAGLGVFDSWRGVSSVAITYSLYVFGVLPLLAHALAMVVSSRRLSLLMHIPLSFYTIFRIAYSGALGALGIRHYKRNRYDGSGL